jgi:cysteinyl-tRNA synthetase
MFFEDLKALNIEPAEHYPAATDHIAEMIALIERPDGAGLAYRSDDGSVYFSIAGSRPTASSGISTWRDAGRGARGAG